MSRGLGVMQRYLLQTIASHGKPVTFAELRRCAIDPSIGFLSWSEERSLRRALQGLVREESLITIGSGGRGDPYRYSLNPILVAITRDQATFEAWIAAIETEISAGSETERRTKLANIEIQLANFGEKVVRHQWAF